MTSGQRPAEQKIQKTWDDYLNASVAEDVAKAAAQAASAPAAASSTIASNGQPAAGPKAKTPSLSTLGIGRGGVIRNNSTVRRSQTSNPVTNPRPAPKVAFSAGVKSGSEPTPEEEAAALNPALAFPSMLTGMDNATQVTELGAAEQPQVTHASTLAELILLAQKLGGNLSLRTSRFVLSVQVNQGSGAKI